MSAIQTQRWLGIRWIGTPFPKRLRLKRAFPFVYVKPMRGCGCMARPKSWLLRLVDYLNRKFPYEKGKN